MTNSFFVLIIPGGGYSHERDRVGSRVTERFVGSEDTTDPFAVIADLYADLCDLPKLKISNLNRGIIIGTL